MDQDLIKPIKPFTKLEVPQAPNPLNKYFRQPAIYVKLPSKGRYWLDDAIDMPVTEELPIYPMTTKDEVILKTPDALMNGSGVVDVIHSCCPNIKNAWAMPSVDVDTVLIAIRIASFGHEMDFSAQCPHCQEENTYAKDLRDCLAVIKAPTYDDPVYVHDDLAVTLKPQAFFASNKANLINFEEQKMMKAIENVKLDPEIRNKEIQDSMRRLLEIGLDNLTASTSCITLDDGTEVTDPEFIREFYSNTESTVVKIVQDRMAALNLKAGIPPFNVECDSCHGEYTVPVEFNYSSFFGKGF
jgi:hypothetical protein